MTSKHIKRFLSTIAIVSMSVGTVQADNIKIAELNWQSGSMIANIDAYILSNGYGHYTELVPGGIDALKGVFLSRVASQEIKIIQLLTAPGHGPKTLALMHTAAGCGNLGIGFS